MFSCRKGVSPVNQEHQQQESTLLEENLKKATTELLILQLLSRQDHFIGELPDLLREQSGGALSIVFPYAAIYRLLDAGHIAELPRRIAPDGRRRQYFGITPKGRAFLEQLRSCYKAFTGGVERILQEGEESHE